MSTCHWAGSANPRMLRSHGRDCDETACQGCEPCPERHCRICGREHVTVDQRGTDETCASCLGDVRNDLATIYALSTRMLGEAIMRGINSEAAVYAGPTANFEDWSRRLVLVGRRGTEKEANAFADDNRDEPHPTWVVGTWEMLIREHLDQPTDEGITLSSARDYLDGHLTRLAHDLDFGFEDLAKELRDCRGRLEDLLHDGERDERGAKCPACDKGRLVKSYGDRVGTRIEYGERIEIYDDRWGCPKCGQWWDDETHRKYLDQGYLMNAEHLPLRDLAQRISVPFTTLRNWAAPTRSVTAERGVTMLPPKLMPSGKIDGRRVYSVTQAERLRDAREEESA